MRPSLLIAIGCIALAVPATVLAGGGEAGFDGVVRSIEHRYHVHATRIPFLGLVSFISRRATNGAVGGIHVAEFESFTEEVDGSELNQMVEDRLGAGWERMIRETSRKGNQQTLIFTHPEGERMGMFVVDLDGSELNVVEVSVDPKHLDASIGQYRHHRDKTGNSERSDGDGPRSASNSDTE